MFYHLLERRFKVPNILAIWMVQRTTKIPESMEETAACDTLFWHLPLCVKYALQHHGTSARLASTGRPTPRSPTHLTAHKARADGHQIIHGHGRASPGRPTTCPVTPALAVAHRVTSSFKRHVARRRRPLHHCCRPGRCRRAIRRIQRSHWRPCRGASPRPPWLVTVGGRCCAHPAQTAPAHHGVELLVCRHTPEKWSQRLIAWSILFLDARRSSKTPRPEKVTKVARKCTEKYSVDWCPKSAFEMMYFFSKHAPIPPLKFWACRA